LLKLLFRPKSNFSDWLRIAFDEGARYFPYPFSAELIFSA